jgi:hypothetical protein
MKVWAQPIGKGFVTKTEDPDLSHAKVNIYLILKIINDPPRKSQKSGPAYFDR